MGARGESFWRQAELTPPCWSMIPKSVQRFSETIMLKQSMIPKKPDTDLIRGV